MVASLLSAVTALIVSRTGAGGVHPLWLLLPQYLVGCVLSPPRRLPAAPVRLHVLRLLAGLWAFGGYYAALASPSARPAEISMLLNIAPVLATFFATPNKRTRLGALVAFCGVAATLGSQAGWTSLTGAHLLALSAAGAYATSIIVVGRLTEVGEAPSTTNALYNSAAGLCVTAALSAFKPASPPVLWPVVAIGVIAAVRIRILTEAAVNPPESARVSVLSNLAFVWLSIAEAVSGARYDARRLCALGLVVLGVMLGSPRPVGTQATPVASSASLAGPLRPGGTTTCRRWIRRWS
jgi:hypothetical protein